jgi:hypothetical protein
LLGNKRSAGILTKSINCWVSAGKRRASRSASLEQIGGMRDFRTSWQTDPL